MKLSILTYSDVRGQEFKNMEGVDTEFAVAAVLDLAATCKALDISHEKDFYWQTLAMNYKGHGREVPPHPVLNLTIEIEKRYWELSPEKAVINSLKLVSILNELNDLAKFSDDFISSTDFFGKPVGSFCASAYFLNREVEEGWKSGIPSENFLQEMEIFKNFYPRLRNNGWNVDITPEKPVFKGEVYYG